MSHTQYPLARLSSAARQLLPRALRCAVSVGRRYQMDATHIRIDWNAPIHASCEPAIVALDTALDPQMAVHMHRELRLTQLLGRLSLMDGNEQQLMAAVAGIGLSNWDRTALRPEFSAHVLALVTEPVLGPFFHVDSPGISYEQVHPLDVKMITRRATSLSSLERIALVSVCGLYNSDCARRTFKRQWNPDAAVAFACMNDGAEAQRDLVYHWYAALSTYPGW